MWLNKACPKVGNYRQIALDNIARYVTDEDYEADESRGIKPDVDDSSNLMYNLPVAAEKVDTGRSKKIESCIFGDHWKLPL